MQNVLSSRTDSTPCTIFLVATLSYILSSDKILDVGDRSAFTVT